MALDRQTCYRALLARDRRFDGRFVTAVTSTRIYCRPVCPTRPPKPENCVFLPTPAAAQALGFRPCLRCRPEAAPATAAWAGTQATVTRALRLIAEGAVAGDRVTGLAARLGVGDRHLRRLFRRHLGAAPAEVAHTRRLLFAKALVSETSMPLAQVAHAAGYGSVRRFNAAFRGVYARPPRALRRAAAPAPAPALRLALPAAEPCDAAAVFAFLAARAVPGVEQAGPAFYRRTLAVEGARAVVEVAPAPGGLAARVAIDDPGRLMAVVHRLHRLFDLDADSRTIDAHLGRDPVLGPLVAARPGLRVPGAVDGFEIAVRAIVGQQVSVKAAQVVLARLAARFGRPLPGAAQDGPALLFPSPADLADAPIEEAGVIRSRAAAIRAVAAALADRTLALDAGTDPGQARAALLAVPGIGPWTAAYIAMRALGDPDAFPLADAGLRRGFALAGGRGGAAGLAAAAEGWRPWRAYAALHLWHAEP